MAFQAQRIKKSDGRWYIQWVDPVTGALDHMRPAKLDRDQSATGGDDLTVTYYAGLPNFANPRDLNAAKLEGKSYAFAPKPDLPDPSTIIQDQHVTNPVKPFPKYVHRQSSNLPEITQALLQQRYNEQISKLAPDQRPSKAVINSTRVDPGWYKLTKAKTDSLQDNLPRAEMVVKRAVERVTADLKGVFSQGAAEIMRTPNISQAEKVDRLAVHQKKADITQVLLNQIASGPIKTKIAQNLVPSVASGRNDVEDLARKMVQGTIERSLKEFYVRHDSGPRDIPQRNVPSVGQVQTGTVKPAQKPDVNWFAPAMNAQTELEALRRSFTQIAQGRSILGGTVTLSDRHAAQDAIRFLNAVELSWQGKDNEGIASQQPRAKTPYSAVNPVPIAQRDLSFMQDALKASVGHEGWEVLSRSADKRVRDAAQRLGVSTVGVEESHDAATAIDARRKAIELALKRKTKVKLGQKEIEVANSEFFGQNLDPNTLRANGRAKIDFTSAQFDAQRAEIVKRLLGTRDGRKIRDLNRDRPEEQLVSDLTEVMRHRIAVRGAQHQMEERKLTGSGGTVGGYEQHLREIPDPTQKGKTVPFINPFGLKIFRNQTLPSGQTIEQFFNQKLREGKAKVGAKAPLAASMSEADLKALDELFHGDGKLDLNELMSAFDQGARETTLSTYEGGHGEDAGGDLSEIFQITNYPKGWGTPQTKGAAEYDVYGRNQNYETLRHRLRNTSLPNLDMARSIDMRRGIESLRTIPDLSPETLALLDQSARKLAGQEKQFFSSSFLGVTSTAHSLPGGRSGVMGESLQWAKDLTRFGAEFAEDAKRERINTQGDGFSLLGFEDLAVLMSATHPKSATEVINRIAGGVMDFSTLKLASPSVPEYGSPLRTLDVSDPWAPGGALRPKRKLIGSTTDPKSKVRTIFPALAKIRRGASGENFEVQNSEALAAFLSELGEDEYGQMRFVQHPNRFDSSRLGEAADPLSGLLHDAWDLPTLGERALGPAAFADEQISLEKRAQNQLKRIGHDMKSVVPRLMYGSQHPVARGVSTVMDLYDRLALNSRQTLGIDPDEPLPMGYGLAWPNNIMAVFLPFNPLFATFRDEIQAGTWQKNPGDATARLRGADTFKYTKRMMDVDADFHHVDATELMRLIRKRSGYRTNYRGEILNSAGEIVKDQTLDENQEYGLLFNAFGHELGDWALHAGITNDAEDEASRKKVFEEIFHKGLFHKHLGVNHLTTGLLAARDDIRHGDALFGEHDETGFHRADRLVNMLGTIRGEMTTRKTLDGSKIAEGHRAQYLNALDKVRSRMGFWTKAQEKQYFPGGYPKDASRDEANSGLGANQRRQRADEHADRFDRMNMALTGMESFYNRATGREIGGSMDRSAASLLVEASLDPGADLREVLALSAEHRVMRGDMQTLEQAAPEFADWLTGRSKTYGSHDLGATGEHAPPGARMLEFGMALHGLWEAIASQVEIPYRDKAGNVKNERMHQRDLSLDEWMDHARGENPAISMSRGMISGVTTQMARTKYGLDRGIGLGAIETAEQARALGHLAPMILEQAKSGHFNKNLLKAAVDLFNWNVDSSQFKFTELGANGEQPGLDPNHPFLPHNFFDLLPDQVGIVDPYEIEQRKGANGRVQPVLWARGRSIFAHKGDKGGPGLPQHFVGGRGEVLNEGVSPFEVQMPSSEEIKKLYSEHFDPSNPQSSLSQFLGSVWFDDDKKPHSLIDERFGLKGIAAEYNQARGRGKKSRFANWWHDQQKLGIISPAFARLFAPEMPDGSDIDSVKELRLDRERGSGSLPVLARGSIRTRGQRFLDQLGLPFVKLEVPAVGGISDGRKVLGDYGKLGVHKGVSNADLINLYGDTFHQTTRALQTDPEFLVGDLWAEMAPTLVHEATHALNWRGLLPADQRSGLVHYSHRLTYANGMRLDDHLAEHYAHLNSAWGQADERSAAAAGIMTSALLSGHKGHSLDRFERLDGYEHYGWEVLHNIFSGTFTQAAKEKEELYPLIAKAGSGEARLKRLGKLGWTSFQQWWGDQQKLGFVPGPVARSLGTNPSDRYSFTPDPIETTAPRDLLMQMAMQAAHQNKRPLIDAASYRMAGDPSAPLIPDGMTEAQRHFVGFNMKPGQGPLVHLGFPGSGKSRAEAFRVLNEIMKGENPALAPMIVSFSRIGRHVSQEMIEQTLPLDALQQYNKGISHNSGQERVAAISGVQTINSLGQAVMDRLGMSEIFGGSGLKFRGKGWQPSYHGINDPELLKAYNHAAGFDSHLYVTPDGIDPHELNAMAGHEIMSYDIYGGLHITPGHQFGSFKLMNEAHKIESIREATKEFLGEQLREAHERLGRSVTARDTEVSQIAHGSMPWIPAANGDQTVRGGVFGGLRDRHRPIMALEAEIGKGSPEKTLMDNIQFMMDQPLSPQAMIELFDPRQNYFAGASYEKEIAPLLPQMWTAANVYAKLEHRLARGEVELGKGDIPELVRYYLHNDQILKPRAYLESHSSEDLRTHEPLLNPAIASKLEGIFGRQMLTTEAQDASPANIDLIRRLAGGFGNTAWSGDLLQTLFDFRGGTHHNLSMMAAAAKAKGSFIYSDETTRFTGGTASFLDKFKDALKFPAGNLSKALFPSVGLKLSRFVSTEKAAGPAPMIVDVPLSHQDPSKIRDWEYEVMGQHALKLMGQPINTTDRNGDPRLSYNEHQALTQILAPFSDSDMLPGHIGVVTRSNEATAEIAKKYHAMGIPTMAQYATRQVENWKEFLSLLPRPTRATSGFDDATLEQMLRSNDFSGLQQSAMGSGFIHKMSLSKGRYSPSPSGHEHIANMVRDILSVRSNLDLPYNTFDPDAEDQEQHLDQNAFVLVGTIHGLKGTERHFFQMPGANDRTYRMKTAEDLVKAREQASLAWVGMSRGAHFAAYQTTKGQDGMIAKAIKQFRAQGAIDDLLVAEHLAPSSRMVLPQAGYGHQASAPAAPAATAGPWTGGSVPGAVNNAMNARQQRLLAKYNIKPFAEGGEVDGIGYDHVLAGEAGPELVIRRDQTAEMVREPKLFKASELSRVLNPEETRRAQRETHVAQKIAAAALGWPFKKKAVPTPAAPPPDPNRPLPLILKDAGLMAHFGPADTAAAADLTNWMNEFGRVKAEMISDPTHGHVVKTQVAGSGEAEITKATLGAWMMKTGQGDRILSQHDVLAMGADAHPAYSGAAHLADVAGGKMPGQVYAGARPEDLKAMRDLTKEVEGAAGKFQFLNNALGDTGKQLADLASAHGADARGVINPHQGQSNHHLTAGPDATNQPGMSHGDITYGLDVKHNIEPMYDELGHIREFDAQTGHFEVLPPGKKAPMDYTQNAPRSSTSGGASGGGGRRGGFGGGARGVWGDGLLGRFAASVHGVNELGWAIDIINRPIEQVGQIQKTAEQEGYQYSLAQAHAQMLTGASGVAGAGSAYSSNQKAVREGYRQMGFFGNNSLFDMTGPWAGMTAPAMGAGGDSLTSVLKGAWGLGGSLFSQKPMDRSTFFHRLGVDSTQAISWMGSLASSSGIKFDPSAIQGFEQLSGHLQELTKATIDAKTTYGEGSKEYKAAVDKFTAAGGNQANLAVYQRGYSQINSGIGLSNSASLIGAWASSYGLDPNLMNEQMGHLGRLAGYTSGQMASGQKQLGLANIIASAASQAGVDPNTFAETYKYAGSAIGALLHSDYTMKTAGGAGIDLQQAKTAQMSAWTANLLAAGISPDQVGRGERAMLESAVHPNASQSVFLAKAAGLLDNNGEFTSAAGSYTPGTFNQAGIFSGRLQTGSPEVMQSVMQLHDTNEQIRQGTYAWQQQAFSLGYSGALGMNLIDQNGNSHLNQSTAPGSLDAGYQGFHGDFAIQAKQIDIQTAQVKLETKEAIEKAPYEKAQIADQIALSQAQAAASVRQAQAQVNLLPEEKQVMLAQQQVQTNQLNRQIAGVQASRAYEDLLYGAPGTDHSYEAYYGSQMGALARSQGMSNVGQYSVGAAVQAVGLQAAQTYRGIDYQQTMLTLGQSSLNSGAMYAAQMKYLDDQKKFAGMQYNAQSQLTKTQRGLEDQSLKEQLELLPQIQKLERDRFDETARSAQEALAIALKQYAVTQDVNAQQKIELEHYDEKLKLLQTTNALETTSLERQKEAMKLQQQAAADALKRARESVGEQQQLRDIQLGGENGYGFFGTNAPPGVQGVDQKGNQDIFAQQEMIKQAMQAYKQKLIGQGISPDQAGTMANEYVANNYATDVTDLNAMMQTFGLGTGTNIKPQDVTGQNVLQGLAKGIADNPNTGDVNAGQTARNDALTAAFLDMPDKIKDFGTAVDTFKASVEGLAGKTGLLAGAEGLSGGLSVLSSVLPLYGFMKIFGAGGTGGLAGAGGLAGGAAGGGLGLGSLMSAGLTGGLMVGAGGLLGYGLDKGMQHFGIEGGGSHYATAAGLGAGLGMMVGGPIGAAVGGAVGLGGYAIYKNWDKISGAAKALFDGMKSAFDAVKGLPWGEIAHVGKQLLEVIFPPFRLVVAAWDHRDELVGLAKSAFGLVKSLFDDIAGFVSDHKDATLEILKTGWNLLAGLFGEIKSFVDDHKDQILLAKDMIMAIIDPIDNAKQFIDDHGGQIVTGAQDLLGLADSLINTLKDGIQAAIDWFNTYKGMILDVVDHLINFVVNGIKDAVNGAIDAIPGARAALGAASDIWGAATSAIPHAAGGYVDGQLSLVGEEGPELIKLPKGTIVEPASRTTQLLRQFAPSGDVLAGAKRSIAGDIGSYQDRLFGLHPQTASNIASGIDNRSNRHVEVNITIESGAQVNEQLIQKLKAEVLATVRQAMEDN